MSVTILAYARLAPATFALLNFGVRLHLVNAVFDSPESTFQTAKAAVEEQRWRKFFEAISASHMNAFLKDGISVGLYLAALESDQKNGAPSGDSVSPDSATGRLIAICQKYDVPLEEIVSVRAAGDPEEVASFEKKLIRRIKDKPAILGELHGFALEETASNYSFISPSFFQDEVLENVVVIEDVAWGDLVDDEENRESIQFKRGKDGWRININCAWNRPREFHAT